MSETARLADQIRRAFEGDAWHGDSVLELLEGVNAKMAAAHPIKNAHSIWELVLHVAAWDGAALKRTGGTAVELRDEQNFPPVKDTSDAAWSPGVTICVRMSRASNVSLITRDRIWPAFIWVK
jgi:uncharacterized damage-inducible protein DinB